MFEINTQITIEDSFQLSEESRKLNDLRYEAGSTVLVLDNLSAMEDLVSELRNLLCRMECQQECFNQLTKSLDMINYCYLSAENKTVDNVEQSRVMYKRKMMNEIDLEDVSKYLRGMYIE